MSLKERFPIKVKELTISSEEYQRVVDQIADLEKAAEVDKRDKELMVKFLHILNMNVVSINECPDDFYNTEKYDYSFSNNTFNSESSRFKMIAHNKNLKK